jgi:colanic acid/amylovoran biosynthesis glycosyltransferase
MRIGLVLPDVPKYSETFFNNKIRKLTESGFEVLVFAGKRNSGKHFFKNYAPYPVHGNKLKQSFSFIYVILKSLLTAPGRTFRLFSKERKDGKSFSESVKSIYLNAHILPFKLDWLHFGYATMSLKRENLAGVMGAKMGVSFRGFDINVYPLKNPGCYDKLWKNVDKVHSISDYLYKKALKLGLSDKTGFEKITPAIDINMFKLKSDSGTINSPLRILTVGRLSWIKNFETAISVIKILKDRGVNVTYDIAGAGTELERLKFAVYQNGLEKFVKFHGQVSQDKIKELMNNSDIYLQPSYQEGFCVSVIEAQATGLLCVVSDADGLKENVIDGVTGWIAPKRKPEKFAEKIEDILKLTDAERKEIALNARKRVEKEFDIEIQKEKFVKFYKD